MARRIVLLSFGMLQRELRLFQLGAYFFVTWIKAMKEAMHTLIILENIWKPSSNHVMEHVLWC